MDLSQDSGTSVQPAEPTRYNGFDWLRGFAVLFIISVHLSVRTAPSWTRISFIGSQTAVELFAATSGFLLAVLLDKSRGKSIAGLVAHRARRLLPSFLAWTFVYLAALSFLDRAFGVPPGYLAGITPRFLVKAFFRGAAEIHLWFVPSLFVASAVLIAADRLLRPPLNGNLVYLAGGAAIGLAGNCIGSNFASHDVRLLGWTMFGLGLSRIVRGADASAALRRIRKCAAAALVPALALCVLAQGTPLWHLADFVVASMLLLALSAPSIPGSRIASFLSRTSLDVYYFHLLVARALSVAIRAKHLEPLDMCGSLCLWMSVWLASLAFAALFGYARSRLSRRPPA